jgi:putative isomerase
MGLSHGGPKARQLALWQIEVMLGGQHETGKIPREVWRDGPQFLGQYGIQAPGLLTMCANRLLKAAKSDEERDAVRKAMADFYPHFVKNHEWFFANPTRTKIGLCIWSGWDSGWDTSTRWDKPQLGALDLDCFLYVDRVELAKMARTLGKDEEARQWDARAKELRDQIRKLHWSEKLGIYNDVMEDGTVSDTMTPAIYWPIWAGVATGKQIANSVKYLDDPKMFGAKWPMPSVALGDPRFTQTEYWRGPTWINLNWIAIRGLERRGQKAAADGLREKTLDLLAHTPVFHEYYNPITGAGLGCPNYGWSAALYVDLTLQP